MAFERLGARGFITVCFLALVGWAACASAQQQGAGTRIRQFPFTQAVLCSLFESRTAQRVRFSPPGVTPCRPCVCRITLLPAGLTGAFDSFELLAIPPRARAASHQFLNALAQFASWLVQYCISPACPESNSVSVLLHWQLHICPTATPTHRRCAHGQLLAGHGVLRVLSLGRLQAALEVRRVLVAPLGGSRGANDRLGRAGSCRGHVGLDGGRRHAGRLHRRCHQGSVGEGLLCDRQGDADAGHGYSRIRFCRAIADEKCQFSHFLRLVCTTRSMSVISRFRLTQTQFKIGLRVPARRRRRRPRPSMRRVKSTRATRRRIVPFSRARIVS